jgi:hypothetical protein
MNFHFLLTYSWFSNIICHRLILIHLNLYLHNISFWPVFFFFELFTLFRCCLYFVSVSTDFTLRKVLRKRSRIRISLLKVESNQTLSSFLIITSLVRMHIIVKLSEILIEV